MSSMLHKTSKLFWPVLVTPKNAVVKPVEAISRSQKLMTELGLIKPASNGTYHILPLCQRAINKCVNLVHHQMHAVDGQQVSLPVLTSSTLWKKTGRLDGDIAEFFMLRDRHGKQFLLSPTHEEAVTSMLATAAPISYRQLPLRLYQVGPKFRDELKARFGLMRAKEFLMKDMYTFDRTITDAQKTYEQLITAYEQFFHKLQVPFVKVKADTGMMGGSMSHEFHYVCSAGEDRILHCKDCGSASNAEISDVDTSCTHCKSTALTEVRGIEVGHAFLLGDKYSRPLQATYLPETGKPTPLVMGCYGIGVSRIVAAAVEVLSTETELRWPTLLAPFDVCVIGPKQGSKEQEFGDPIEQQLCGNIVDICGMDEILHDDRKYMTIGKRLMEAKRMGYPFVVVIGAGAASDTPKLELHTSSGKKMELPPNELLHAIKQYTEKKNKLLNSQHVVDINAKLHNGVSDAISLKC